MIGAIPSINYANFNSPLIYNKVLSFISPSIKLLTPIDHLAPYFITCIRAPRASRALRANCQRRTRKQLDTIPNIDITMASSTSQAPLLLFLLHTCSMPSVDVSVLISCIFYTEIPPVGLILIVFFF